MAKKSTRHKIRVHADNAVKAMDDCFYHLQSLHSLADGGSTIIDENVPALMQFGDQYQKMLVEFSKLL